MTTKRTNPKFKRGQRVKLLHTYTSAKTGVVIDIEIKYIVKQDDGMAFWYEESEVEKLND